MEKKKTSKNATFLEEAAQLKIYGGKTSFDTHLTINIDKKCKKNPWGDCKEYCYMG
mgnify:CR=1 FL=1|jgi:hypothetical protein